MRTLRCPQPSPFLILQSLASAPANNSVIYRRCPLCGTGTPGTPNQQIQCRPSDHVNARGGARGGNHGSALMLHPAREPTRRGAARPRCWPPEMAGWTILPLFCVYASSSTRHARLDLLCGESDRSHRSIARGRRSRQYCSELAHRGLDGGVGYPPPTRLIHPGDALEQSNPFSVGWWIYAGDNRLRLWGGLGLFPATQSLQNTQIPRRPCLLSSCWRLEVDAGWSQVAGRRRT